MKQQSMSLLLALLILSPGSVVAQERKHRKNSEALQAARNAKTDAQLKEALTDVLSGDAEDSDDVIATYESIKLLDAKKLDPRKERELYRIRAALSQKISRSVQAQNRQAIKSLIEGEADAIPSKPRAISPATSAWLRDEEARFERLQVLMKAAGDGKNRDALPVLRKIAKERANTMYSDQAISAIGKIGDPEDLRAFIQQVKQNPKSRINLQSFGPAVIDPVVNELDAGTLSDEQRGALRAVLSEGRSHTAIPQYRRLLTHKDPEVIRIAAQAIGAELKNTDKETVREMLRSPDSAVRFPAVNAIAGQAWDAGYAEELIDILKNDKDPGIRIAAMSALAGHGVKAAVPVIDLMRKDSNRRVRENAEYFSKKLSVEGK